MKTDIRFRSILGLVAACLLAGCGGGRPYGTVQVKGRITYEDGSLIPADRVQLSFVPQSPKLDEKTYPRPGIAKVNVADGTFDTTTTYEYGDGIIAGPHKVLVRTSTKEDMPTDDVPIEYGSPESSPLVVDTSQSPFELKVRKPK